MDTFLTRSNGRLAHWYTTEVDDSERFVGCVSSEGDKFYVWDETFDPVPPSTTTEEEEALATETDPLDFVAFRDARPKDMRIRCNISIRFPANNSTQGGIDMAELILGSWADAGEAELHFERLLWGNSALEWH